MCENMSVSLHVNVREKLCQVCVCVCVCVLTRLKYQISLKSAWWKPSCSMRTDGHDEANSRFSKVCERA
jgi:hypothetical protein